MTKFEEEQAVNSPLQEESFNNQDPRQICNTFRARIVCFISDLEKLLRNPSIKENSTFLNKIAGDIVALETLSGCTGCCKENIIEAGRLIHNVITYEIDIPGKESMTTTTLELAKKYRQDKNTLEVFSLMLCNYLNNPELTESLITQLKVLAFDIKDD